MFWFIGFIVFYNIEPNLEFVNVLLVSLGFRESGSNTDFAGFYQLIWPILLEVIVFGFIFGSLLEKFNPPLTCKLLAKRQSDHTVVIGYHHFGRRIVDFLRDNKKRYTVIEEHYENIDDLVEAGEPVVSGDPTEMVNLKFAAVDKCKEVFVVSNEIREAVVISEKIRNVNPSCKLYVRIFEEYFQDYLAKPPISAFTFSTTRWIMESIEDWTRGKRGDVLVIGRDHLVELIGDQVGYAQNRHVTILDPYIDPEHVPITNSHIKVIKDQAKRIPYILKHVDLSKVTQVFLCWKQEDEFSDSLFLTSRLRQQYPDI